MNKVELNEFRDIMPNFQWYKYPLLDKFLHGYDGAAKELCEIVSEAWDGGFGEGRRSKESLAIQMLTELSDAWRGDWAEFDGRTLRYQVRDIVSVLNGNSDITIEEFRSKYDLCEGGGGHWRRGRMECSKCKVTP